MLLFLLGVFWVVLGGIFLVFPEKMRNRVQRKGMKRVRQILFFAAWIIGGAFIGAAWEIGSGALAIILVVVGVIAILKGMLMLKRSAAEKIVEYVGKISVSGLRAIAALYILMGAGLIAMSYFN